VVEYNSATGVDVAHPHIVTVEIIQGPDVPAPYVSVESGTITARIPSPSGGTLIAGTVVAGTILAADLVRAVALAARVHVGETSVEDAARQLGGRT